MIVVRLARPDDIDAVLALAQEAYPGMTTLPPDRDALALKIASSCSSIEKPVTEVAHETYMLVMEDTETGQVVGTASIIAQLGEDDQFYSYKLNKVTHQSRVLDKKVSVQLLNLSNHFEGFAEVATLFLTPAYRKNSNGKLLARSRYLFMAMFRERFPEQVMADLRGYFDDNGQSPFWDAVGQHFFDMSFSDADLYGALNGNQFISDLMPSQPVYVNLLPEKAQAVIGKPNDAGRPALKMLENEGFRWHGHIDIFDGAPSVDTPIDLLLSVRECRSAALQGAGDKLDGPLYLVAAGDPQQFTVCISPLELDADGAARLPGETIAALPLTAGSNFRFVEL